LKWKDKLWEHHCQRKYSRLKFKQYILKNRCVDSLFASWTPKGAEKPRIAWGDGSFAPTGKGEQAVPCKEFYRRCKRYYNTVLVNEFRTSKLCNCCHQPLEDVYEVKKPKIDDEKKEESEVLKKQRAYPIRGLKQCRSTGCPKYVNRDKNASKNQLSLYHLNGSGGEIPENFSRLKKFKDTEDDVRVIGSVSVVFFPKSVFNDFV
jgi:hypothetical protein